MKKKSMDGLGRMSAGEFAGAVRIPVIVILDNIRSFNNVGSFFRTCDCMAVEKLILCGITPTPPHRDIHKTALGAENTVAWEYCKDTAYTVGNLALEGWIPVAVEQVEESVSLESFHIEPGRKYVLVFGNEVDGISDPALGKCKVGLEIPQAGTKHSFNVAVSAGIVLWKFFESLYIPGKSV